MDIKKILQALAGLKIRSDINPKDPHISVLIELAEEYVNKIIRIEQSKRILTKALDDVIIPLPLTPSWTIVAEPLLDAIKRAVEELT